MRQLTLKGQINLFFNSILSKIIFFAWLFFAFLFWVFYSSGDVDDLQMLIGKNKLSDGFITYKEYTGSSVNENDVFEFYYNYSLNGEIISGRSFGYDYYDIDSPVTIQHLVSNPQISRVVGQKNTVIGLTSTIILAILFLLFTLLLLLRLKKTKKDIMLVKRGEIAKGDKSDINKTNVIINGKNQYQVAYQFTVNGVNHHCYTKTTNPSQLSSKEKVIYLPNKPDKALLIHTLPKNIQTLLRW